MQDACILLKWEAKSTSHGLLANRSICGTSDWTRPIHWYLQMQEWMSSMKENDQYSSEQAVEN